MQVEDWAFCRESLQRHSRTFAIPIAMLTPELERAITCSYILCRIADTVEDTPDWATADKQRLFRALQDCFVEPRAEQVFVEHLGAMPGGDPSERALLQGLPRVMRVFRSLPKRLREPCTDGIVELIGGMMVYAYRRPGSDGVRCLTSSADLDRYCYFVAGVIGTLLTESFVAELADVGPRAATALRANAEQFGAGLQLVNILRDLSTDLQRRVCYVPRTSLAAEGLTPDQLCAPEHRGAARRVLLPLFERARGHLDAAFEYTLAIPATAPEVRRFCLVPLWLAVATLEMCRTDEALLSPGERVKLSRTRVVELINECVSACGDDARLREFYAALDAPPVEAA